MQTSKSRRCAAAFVVMVALTLATASAEDLHPLSPSELKHLKGESLVPVTKVADLPAAVRTALETLFGGLPLSLAEPDAPFAVTDVVVDQQLPGRRLIAAGCSTDHCLVHYERGGIAHVYYAVLFAVSNGTSRLEWGGLASGRMTGLNDVKAEVVANRLKPARDW